MQTEVVAVREVKGKVDWPKNAKEEERRWEALSAWEVIKISIVLREIFKYNTDFKPSKTLSRGPQIPAI